MHKITCVIIEDERPAQEVLRKYISKIEWLELIAVFDDAISSIDFLRKNAPDILFLDISIPEISGIDFLKIFKGQTSVIITTAYSEHAVEAFELEASDYLKKPFSFERFLKAVSKFSRNTTPLNISPVAKDEEEFAFFNVNKTMVRVNFSEIIYIESMREYIYLHTENNTICTRISIQEIEKMLGPNFMRIHRSFIINTKKIKAFNAEEVFVHDKTLPIGISYKKQVEAFFKRNLLRESPSDNKASSKFG